MMINMDKTKIIHFRRKRKPRTEREFKLGNDEIEKASLYKYLGLEIDEYLLRDKTVETLAKSGSKALGSLIAKYLNAKGLKFGTFTKLFNSTVVPVMHYGSEIWGVANHPKLKLINFTLISAL